MTLSLNSILKNWPHESSDIKMRKIAVLDDCTKSQLRVGNMKWSICVLMAMVFLIGPRRGAAEESPKEKTAVQTPSLTEEVRKELLDTRATAWQSFFQKDLSVVESILAPELIAIQQNSERWDNRARLIAIAKAIHEQGVQLVRLEFPHTEIQLFGDTAILYYTYIFETGVNGKSVVDAGRGTEIFVRRDGKWIDVGWHLDNGPFSHKGGEWIRVGETAPEPSLVSPSRPKS
jgi:hypothetical protein